MLVINGPIWLPFTSWSVPCLSYRILTSGGSEDMLKSCCVEIVARALEVVVGVGGFLESVPLKSHSAGVGRK